MTKTLDIPTFHNFLSFYSRPVFILYQTGEKQIVLLKNMIRMDTGARFFFSLKTPLCSFFLAYLGQVRSQF